MCMYHLRKDVAAGKSYLIFLITALFLFIANTASCADSGETGRQRLLKLRQSYLKELEKKSDPDAIIGVALTTTGKSWALAALVLAERYNRPEISAHVTKAVEECEKIESMSKLNPGKVQLAGLELIYTSLENVASIAAVERNDKKTYSEIRLIDDHLKKSYKTTKGREYNLVSLSNGIMSMLALSIRSADQGRRYLNVVDKSLNETLEKSKMIGERPDLHYHARLFLMANNNLQGCFKLAYLFNKAMGGDLAAEVEPVKHVVDKNAGNGDSLLLKLVVSSTAFAEASFSVVTAITGE